MGEITLTLKEAVEVWPVLDELVEGPWNEDRTARLPAEKIPAGSAYRIGKFHRKLKPEVEDYEKKRMAIFTQLGTSKTSKDEEVSWTIKDENIEEFTSQMKVLQDELAILTGVAKVAFADISHLDFKSSTMLALEPFIEGLDDA